MGAGRRAHHEHLTVAVGRPVPMHVPSSGSRSPSRTHTTSPASVFESSGLDPPFCRTPSACLELRVAVSRLTPCQCQRVLQRRCVVDGVRSVRRASSFAVRMPDGAARQREPPRRLCQPHHGCHTAAKSAAPLRPDATPVLLSRVIGFLLARRNRNHAGLQQEDTHETERPHNRIPTT